MLQKPFSIVRRNFILSMGFGLLMGIVFPLYARIFVQFKSTAMMIIFTAGCIAAGILVGLVAFMISKYTVLKAVEMVSSELKAMTLGEGDLSKEIQLESDDVIGELISWFNRFVSQTRHMVVLSQRSGTSAIDFSSKVTDTMERAARSVDQITMLIKEVNLITGQQHSEMGETKAALDKLNNAVLTVITYILELFSQMDSLTQRLLVQSTAIDEIAERTAATIKIIGKEGMSNSSDDSLSAVSAAFIRHAESQLGIVSDHLKRLADFMSDIEGIANKTGVLSINASIEAARVGAAGRGFKVISQEIQKLASEQKTLIASIQGNLEISGREIADTQESVTSSRAQFSRILTEAKTSFSEVSGNTEQIKSNTRNVRESYHEISEMLTLIKDSLTLLKDTTKNTVTKLENVDTSTNTISQRMTKMSDDSEEITRLTSDTREHMQLLKVSVEDANKYIQRFKTEEH